MVPNARFPDPDGRFLDPDGRFPDPIPPKNDIVTKTFAPKFRSEPSDREVPSSYGDYFRDNFCDCDSEPLSGNFQSTFGQLPNNFLTTFEQLSARAANRLEAEQNKFQAFCAQRVAGDIVKA